MLKASLKIGFELILKITAVWSNAYVSRKRVPC